MRNSTRTAETLVFALSVSLIGGFTTVAMAASMELEAKNNVVTEQVTEYKDAAERVRDSQGTQKFITKAAAEREEEVKIRTLALSLEQKKLANERPSRTILSDYRNRKKPLEPEELKNLLSLVGFEGEALKMAWGIVMRESRGGPTAHNGNTSTGDNSYGLFQINMIGSLGEARREKYGLASNDDLFDPITNAQIAYLMSNKGRDFGAWGVGPNAYNGGKVGDLYSWVSKFPNN